MYSFFEFSIEKIYQTLETMFYQLLKQLECRQSHSAAVVLSIFFSVFGYPDETLSLVCDVIYQTRRSVSSGYPNTENRVENTTWSGVFLTKFGVFG